MGPMARRPILHGIAMAALLYAFLVGIKLMGESFELFGSGLAEELFTLTAHPLAGLFIGVLATVIVQSSSVSTSVIVGLVASGALSIAGAIPMVMGANIGTSVTNTIVSLAHICQTKDFQNAFAVATVHDIFNMLAVLILLPLELGFHVLERSAAWLAGLLDGAGGIDLASPLSMALKPAVHALEFILFGNAALMLVVSFALLGGSLLLIVRMMRQLVQSEFRHKLHEHVFSSPWRSFALGIGLTVLVQSSSVTTSLAVPLAAVGLVTVQGIFPYIMGANIGTTATALLASLATGSPAAVTVALTHLLFNIFGAVLIYPIRRVPIALSTHVAALSLRSRIYPIAYIALVFFGVPAIIIALFSI